MSVYFICMICNEKLKFPENKVKLKKGFFETEREFTIREVKEETMLLNEEMMKNFWTKFEYWSSYDDKERKTTQIGMRLCKNCSLEVANFIKQRKATNTRKIQK